MAKKQKPETNPSEFIPLCRDWTGWRWTDSGMYLVSPDGDQISAHRLKGLLWRDSMELRRAGYASRKSAEKNRANRQKVKVLVVDLGDYRDRNCGQAAG